MMTTIAEQQTQLIQSDIHSSASREVIHTCIVDEIPCESEKFFIKAHCDYLPGRITTIDGIIPRFEGRYIHPQNLASRAMRKGMRWINRKPWDWEVTGALLKVFRKTKPDVVLAEWGPTAARVREACSLAGLPLVAHFHGYDASETSVLDRLKKEYQLLFRDAAALVVVSQAMRNKLIELGAPSEKVKVNSYGVDCSYFSGADPAVSSPVFVSVGRFVDKKAPHLVLQSFASVHRDNPDTRLKMIGDGPLLTSCQDLAEGLQIAHAVQFLGWQEAKTIRNTLTQSRCFVQHSVTARNGDCEGLPNTVLEAGACGLPVVSTRHAGIPDAIVEGSTGFLVEERDVCGMASKMKILANDARLAGTMGRAARERAVELYSVEKSISGLYGIITNCVAPLCPDVC